ncbi:MAG: GIY-YIG nuclease family protein [Clostridia bacterium]|nr:GIY-YIG nuclease family protein [Clostridia bacterium]
MYYIYIIMCENNILYTGIAKDIEKRLHEHYFKLKSSAKFTKSHQMLELKTLYLAENRSDASKLEYLIKKLTKKQKLLLINDEKYFNELFSTYIDTSKYTFITKENQLEIFSKIKEK